MTPSFFCRLDDEVVYWNTIRFSGIDEVNGGLRHQRRLVEAAEDQLQLAGIGVDVADGENPRFRSLELRRIDRDQVLLEIDPPIGDRAELHRQAEERQQPRAGDVGLDPLVVLDRRRSELAALALQPADLTEREVESCPPRAAPSSC